MHLEVILREDIKGLGKAGALVRVKPGYARNFLLPRGLAFEATEGNKRRIESEHKARANRAATDRAEAQALADKLGAVALKLSAKAGEGDKLFGSITSSDLADALAKQGFEIDRRRIELEHPIKQLGTHPVSIRIHPDVTAQLQVTIAAE